MNHAQLKKLIEEQVELLQEPLKIDSEVQAVMKKHNLSENQVNQILGKVNGIMRKAHKQRFNKQVTHQIVQQISKNEEEKMLKVGEMLSRANSLTRQILCVETLEHGITVEQQVKRLTELAEILPEPEYLKVYENSKKPEQVPESEQPEEPEQNLIQDNEERVRILLRKELRKQQEQEIEKEVSQALEVEKQRQLPLIEQYAELRTRLLETTEKLVYASQKLDFLKKLQREAGFLTGVPKAELADSDDELEPAPEVKNADLQAQLTKFRILVEKLDYVSG